MSIIAALLRVVQVCYTISVNLFHALILSVVEGISEFLPISSTGHQILTAKLLGITQTNFVGSFEIYIQVGAILAVISLYWKTFLKNKKVWRPLLAAFIPTAIVGLLLYKIIKNVFLGNSMITVIMLLLGGIILILVEKNHKEKDEHVGKVEDISLQNAFLIGIGQSLSVIPGVSRAAATIITALLLKTKRKTATEFSFLLAVPTMIAASGLDLVKSGHSFSSSEWMILLFGFVVSFIVALFSVKWLLTYIQRHNFVAFGYYRIIVAILFFLIVLR
jgi:undecaprenyl-diphosphatase